MIGFGFGLFFFEDSPSSSLISGDLTRPLGKSSLSSTMSAGIGPGWPRCDTVGCACGLTAAFLCLSLFTCLSSFSASHTCLALPFPFVSFDEDLPLSSAAELTFSPLRSPSFELDESFLAARSFGTEPSLFVDETGFS